MVQKRRVRSQSILWILGGLWTAIGFAERSIGWLSGALATGTENAVSNIEKWFDSIPLLGDDTAQTVMITGGLILISVAVTLWFTGKDIVSMPSTAEYQSPVALSLYGNSLIAPERNSNK